ncbi:hypothetical protein E4417_16435 [Stenotrophomonas maltophilia]|uniref:hypothetical protein n=1 Tax=Stenotrophomonas maltophilia TaxID=40324 RepID=UPI001094D221|nr:hypothetical protein [Stenotrophomonas maltophilia]TGW16814.1 hypothetical protein E4417_16435 [Stenotrophomonas maltophilia]
MALEILIASAAPAAESTGDFWKYGLPVVSLILGILLKWLLDWSTEGRRERAAKELRIEQRRDVLQSRLTDAERANLLELQPLLSEVMAGIVVAHNRAIDAFQDAQGQHPWLIPRDGQGSEQARLATLKAAPIRVRLHARDLSARISAVLNDDSVFQAKSPQASTEAVTQLMKKFIAVQEAIGAEIRRLETVDLSTTLAANVPKGSR